MVLSSIAIENPKVATPVTGATNVIKPITKKMNDPCWMSVNETIHTPIIWIHVNNLKSVCV